MHFYNSMPADSKTAGRSETEWNLALGGSSRITFNLVVGKSTFRSFGDFFLKRAVTQNYLIVEGYRLKFGSRGLLKLLLTLKHAFSLIS